MNHMNEARRRLAAGAGAEMLGRRSPSDRGRRRGIDDDRLRAWKVELAKLAQETGLRITVCHFPPGTSKWNRIEHLDLQLHHREPESLRTIVELISAITTKTGRTIQADSDPTC